MPTSAYTVATIGPAHFRKLLSLAKPHQRELYAWMRQVTGELFDTVLRNLKTMQQIYSWSWVESQVAQTIEVWNGAVALSVPRGPQYSPKEQLRREKAYGEALRAVEREVKRAPRTRAERIETQARMVTSFAEFSMIALDLGENAVNLLANDFLPVATKLARWARQFDASLSMADIIQACRNAWTACGLQPLVGERIGITPSILGYSLLYPYSDNYLDRADISAEAKLQFSQRFRNRLRGDRILAQGDREAALWTLVQLIEGQYPRACITPRYLTACWQSIKRRRKASLNWGTVARAVMARHCG